MIGNYFLRIIKRKKKGSSLIETLVGVAVFALIAMGIYAVFTQATQLVRASRSRIAAAALANEQIEIIRNLPYASVGTQSGIPVGVVAPLQNIIRDGIPFTVHTTIRNIDDPFDGTTGGSPHDTAPADYKLAEITVSCAACTGNPPLIFTSTIAPKNLEAASTNGSLFIRAFDANGQPVPQANVQVVNNAIFPVVTVNDTTNNSGVLQLVDVPTSTESYEITVTKSGYSTDRSYSPNAPGNPNPSLPHASVLAQQVTQVSFGIDRLSNLNIVTVNQICGQQSNIDILVEGSKLIGTDPNIKKYSQDYTTDGNGQRNLSSMEWDAYTISLTDAGYDLAGSIPLMPLDLVPNAVLPATLIVRNHTSNSLLVTVTDGATQLPLTEAQVHLSGTGFDGTLETNKGYLSQTDWAGGGSQTTFTDITRYYDNDGGLDATTTPGDILLKKTGATYATDGSIISSTFDFGPGVNYVAINWHPTDQPLLSGTQSVRMQIASNNDNATWVFTGPDGTPGSSYAPGINTVHSSHSGNRYLRYLLLIHTDDTAFTPNVSDIELTYINGCVPPGQVFFPNLTAQTYTIEVGRFGYATTSDLITVSGKTTFQKGLSP